MKKRTKKWLVIVSIIAGLWLFGYLVLRICFSEVWHLKPIGTNILGFDGKKNYLVLFQNDAELRPTGGFIGSFGILETNYGFISLDFRDSYSLPLLDDLAEAPEEFKTFIKDPKFKGWYFRDGNTAPDFRKSADQIIKLYNEQSNDKRDFDGVLAVNFGFIENLADVYDLKVNGKPVNSDTIFADLEFSTKNIDTRNEEDLENRKSAIKFLAEDLISEMIFSPTKYGDLSELMANAFKEKDLLIYLKDQDLQQKVLDLGYGGHISKENNFIHSSISNIGGLKADRYVEKSHQYYVRFNEEGRAIAEYNLELKNYGSYNLFSDWYKAFNQIVIPEGSEVLTLTGDFYNNLSNIEDGEVNAYFLVQPNEEKNLRLTYLLPEEISFSNFNLDLIKQPGTEDYWQVFIQYPGDSSATGDYLERKENVVSFKGVLKTDLQLRPTYVQDSFPPLVTSQNFLETNKIVLRFSEKLDGRTLKPENFSVRDLNYENEQTDTVKVVDIDLKGQELFIFTEGISKNFEERYAVEMRGIRDIFGNTTVPELLEITLVQRL